MSRIVRRQLLEVVEALKEGHRSLQTLLMQGEVDRVINLLSECQEAAIMIGNQIESIYGEGHSCVQVLEQYCENLFHMAESLEQSQSLAEYYRAVALQLEELEVTMERELPDKLEVVFFPYKVSLWKSLEKMYLDAVEDEACEPYCVPIPYYDLNADKSFGEFHEESAEYPENVVVTNWKEYDFELRKPDVIIIHNPYDNMGTESSVEPRFYAGNLCQYTEKLVYVPYFVLEDIKPDDEVAIENMRHYCFLPGVIHADKVIVQSENMRRIYINEYVKAADLCGMEVDEEALDDKILGLGSALFDERQCVEPSSIVVPKEWEELLLKSDGTRKKAILYHTGINELLYHGEEEFRKMESVFEVFCAMRNEIALWWRPHELLLNRLEELNPILWEGFKKLVEKYREESWGIYDDTEDRERAINATHAFYGDFHTMVWEYQKQGKPVLLQDVSER